jgi:hypothetical protein
MLIKLPISSLQSPLRVNKKERERAPEAKGSQSEDKQKAPFLHKPFPGK